MCKTIAELKTIHWKIEDMVGHLIINRPPSNRMDKMFFGELKDLVETVISVSKIEGLIVYGAGRHFSSGADLDELTAGLEKDTSSLFENNLTFLSLFALPFPVVAAISGVCLGSGLELALFAHFRICTENSMLGLPESTFGLIPGIGGVSRLHSLAGHARATELICSGMNILPKEALEYGIIDKIVPKKHHIDFSVNFVKKINRKFHADRIHYLVAACL